MTSLSPFTHCSFFQNEVDLKNKIIKIGKVIFLNQKAVAVSIRFRLLFLRWHHVFVPIHFYISPQKYQFSIFSFLWEIMSLGTKWARARREKEQWQCAHLFPLFSLSSVTFRQNFSDNTIPCESKVVSSPYRGRGVSYNKNLVQCCCYRITDPNWLPKLYRILVDFH